MDYVKILIDEMRQVIFVSYDSEIYTEENMMNLKQSLEDTYLYKVIVVANADVQII